MTVLELDSDAAGSGPWVGALVARCLSLKRLSLRTGPDLNLSGLERHQELQRVVIKAGSQMTGSIGFPTELYRALGTAMSVKGLSVHFDAYQEGDGKLSHLRGLRDLESLTIQTRKSGPVHWEGGVRPLLQSVGSKLKELTILGLQYQEAARVHTRPAELAQLCANLRFLRLSRCGIDSVAAVHLYTMAFPQLEGFAVYDVLALNEVSTETLRLYLKDHRPKLKLALLCDGEMGQFWKNMGLENHTVELDKHWRLRAIAIP